MGLLPVAAIRSQIEEELPAARGWAERHGCRLEYDEEEVRLRVALSGPGGEPYLLEGVFDDYPTLPPCWRFVDPHSGERIGQAAYPRPADPYPRGSALVIESGTEGVVVCAHFNRLAFAEQGGPHGDWGPLANWRNPGSSAYTFAETIGDMLSRIALEVGDSSGRMGELP
jgi:hypothetical protein